jgi:hypothetical protein
MPSEHGGEQPQTIADPEKLISIKENLFTLWQQLPPEHQASVALVLVDAVRSGEWGPWLREAIDLQWPEDVGDLEPEHEFSEWMERVDQVIWGIVGCSVHDLPDCDFFYMFEDGAPLKEAAETELSEAGFKLSGKT